MSSSAFHRRITAGFILVLICAGLIAVASIAALRSIRARSEAITRTYAHEVILVERLEGLSDSKAAAGRGFLMSGEEMYAQRLQTARDESDEIIGELRRSIQSREGQQQLDAIEKSEKEHQADIDAAVALRRSGAKLDRVIEHWRLNAGVRREELRGAIESLRTRKQVLLEQAEQEQAHSSQLLTRIIVGMATAGLLLAALLAFMLGRTLVRMYNAESAAREAADEARQWFATTLGSIGDAVIATDTRGRVTFLNPTAEMLTGWDDAEAKGKSLDDVFPIHDERTGEPQESPVKRVLQTGVAMQLANHTLLVARDGQTRPIDDNAAPIRDARRNITGVVLVFRDVSERRRAELAIRESKEWLATTLRSIGDAVIAADKDGRITLMNPVAQRLTGWTESHAIGAPLEAVFNIVNEETRKRLQNPAEKVLATGQVVGLANHTVLIAKDGTEWPLDDSGAPIRDAQGNIVGVVLVFREVTERRRVEDTLRRLSAIVESSNDAIIGKTLDGTITTWNTAAEHLYGYTAEETVGRSISLLVPEGQQDEMPDILHRLAQGERIQHFETVRRRKDGSLISVWLNVSPIRDAVGRVVGASTIVRDITERKRAEEALGNAHQHQRLALEAAGLGAWDYRFESGEVLWDDCCRAQFGFNPGDHVTDEAAIARIYPEDRANVRAALQRALAGVDNGAYHVEFRVMPPDGSTRWIASHGRVYFSGEGQQRRPVRFIGVNSDATARKHADAAMLRSEKLASVGRLAATIAHEINNPLEAATNALYLALTDASLSDSTRTYLQTADEQLGRVAQLTRQTLGFYRESKTPTLVKTPDLIEDVLGLYRRKCEDKRIAINRRYDFQDGGVCGTAGELRQVFSNLIANSLDALPGGGKLYVRVKRCPASEGTPALRLTVADTGTGISPDHLGRIFEPFFTTKQAVGTGLGLWITQEIVTRHGGRMIVRSRPGKGTIFWIYLPVAEKSTAVAARA